MTLYLRQPSGSDDPNIPKETRRAAYHASLEFQSERCDEIFEAIKASEFARPSGLNRDELGQVLNFERCERLGSALTTMHKAGLLKAVAKRPALHSNLLQTVYKIVWEGESVPVEQRWGYRRPKTGGAHGS